jgi:hypothetical protein
MRLLDINLDVIVTDPAALPHAQPRQHLHAGIYVRA